MIFKKKYPYQRETEEGFAWLPVTARCPQHNYTEVTVWLQPYKVEVCYESRHSLIFGQYLEKVYVRFL